LPVVVVVVVVIMISQVVIVLVLSCRDPIHTYLDLCLAKKSFRIS